MGVTGAARKKFVEQYRNAVPRQVAEVLFGIRPPGESSIRRLPLYPKGPPSPPQIPQHPSWHWSETIIPGPAPVPVATQNSITPSAPANSANPIGYDEPKDESEAIPVATVQVRLDLSKAGRILIPVSFRTSSTSSVIASVLVDTGSMANFISDWFIREHRLSSRRRKTAIQCVGFDGQPGHFWDHSTRFSRCDFWSAVVGSTDLERIWKC
ncbi:hypothetical protein PTTG_30405 [Puccinia triticina 1-1 BBBD Race 1]|uniref:Uncharacterized protein n=1 Tax=Puccinia triticina (isolate 1-1 / race 1 (BBBD)) TaxID=630390 RepID=A0A180FYU6_PUCT1|nr:hypothetical protein PTTG_30405 [Puccinia triticina 1-1 BBBD Race 1]